jgi:alpha-galactosidase
MTARRLLVALSLILLIPAVSMAGNRTIASRNGLKIQSVNGDREWALGNDRITVLFGLDENSSFGVKAILIPGTDRRIDLGGSSDHFVTMGGQVAGFGVTGEGWTFVEATTADVDGSLRLGFVYRHEGERLTATRWYATSPNTPTIESWSTYTADESPVVLSGLNLWHIVLPVGGVDWLTGLQVPEGSGGPFSRQHSDLQPGDQLNLGANGRSSEYTVPWFAVDEGPDKLYAGIMWSGAWGAYVRRLDEGLRLSIGLPATVTTVEPGTTLETPHFFFGVAPGPNADAAASLRPFLRETLRHGRGWDPLVTYNTWFAYGTHVTEDVVMKELEANAALGTELFVLDAGWYPGHHDYWEFSGGLGHYTADEERFPNGLAVLGDEARNRGMRFGIWVEPERVDLATVFDDGEIPERWLAQHDGSWDPSLAPENTTAAQICLSDAEARQWLFEQLSRFIEANRPDYLKWDNNLWVNCNRPGHGHGTEDGNFKHVQGLYSLLAALRERFPGLVIENVSGGGNRLDLGMARYTDTAWMDDRSAPSVHVRHNLEGLSEVFPSAYLLSFMMDHAEESVFDPADLSMYVRSRMPGVLGLCFRTADLDEAVRDQLTREVSIYKSVRDVLRNGTLSLLTPQTWSEVEGGWDAVQATSAELSHSVLFVYQQNDGVDDALIRPRGLVAEQAYLVQTVDDGEIGVATGADLMNQGLGLHDTGRTAAQIIVLRPISAEAAAKRQR